MTSVPRITLTLCQYFSCPSQVSAQMLSLGVQDMLHIPADLKHLVVVILNTMTVF